MTSRDPSQELSAALEQKRLLVDLASAPGFLYLSSLLQEQVDAIQQDILFTPCAGVDSAMAQEYKKGSLEGRLAWEQVRTAYINSLDITINHLRSKIDAESERATDGNTSAP